MKKLGLLALLTLTTILNATTVTPYIEMESNKLDNDAQMRDEITMGLSVVKPISDKTTISIDAKTTDYDYIGDENNSGGTTNAESRERIIAYITNQLYKNENGAKISLALGTQLDNSTLIGSKAVSYRIKPMVYYPINKTLALKGDWLLTKDKTDKTGSIGDYYFTHELNTSLIYTGIKNITIAGGFYNYKKDNIDNGQNNNEIYNQIRGSVSTKMKGFSLTPFIWLDLGKYKFYDTTGKESSTLERQRKIYGMSIGKVVNNVNYQATYFLNNLDFTNNVDRKKTYANVSATYTF